LFHVFPLDANAKRSFYRAANAIFAEVGRFSLRGGDTGVDSSKMFTNSYSAELYQCNKATELPL